jgi:hypothetical protein
MALVDGGHMRTKALILIVAIMGLLGAVQAQTNPAIQQAVNTVPAIQKQMNDPDSFVLISVFQTKPTKKTNGYVADAYNLCYVFRSHNAMGGYGDPQVALQLWSFKKAENNGRLEFIGTAEDAKYGAGHGQCEPKNLALDLTNEVKTALGNK